MYGSLAIVDCESFTIAVSFLQLVTGTSTLETMYVRDSRWPFTESLFLWRFSENFSILDMNGSLAV